MNHLSLRSRRRAAALLATPFLLVGGTAHAATLTWVGPTDGSGDLYDSANWTTTQLQPVEEPAGSGDFLFFGYRTDENAFSELTFTIPTDETYDLGFGGWRIGFRGEFDLEVGGGGTIRSSQLHLGRWDAPRDSHGTLTLTGPGTTWIGTGFQAIGLTETTASTETSVATGILNLNQGATFIHSGGASFKIGTDEGKPGSYEGTININGSGNTLAVTNPDSILELGVADTGGSGGSGLGTLNLNGGLVDVNTTITLGRGNGGTGILNLGNGADESTLRARAILGGDGTSTVNFNGVTYQAAAAEQDLISGLDTAKIEAAGLAIDLAGLPVFLSQQNFTGEGAISITNSTGEGNAELYFSGSYPGGEIVVGDATVFRPLSNPDAIAFGQLTVNPGATFGPIYDGTLLADDFDAEPVEGWDPNGGEFGEGDPEDETFLDLAWEYGVPTTIPASPNGGNVYAAKLDGFTEEVWTQSWLQTPVLDLTSLSNATLTFSEFLSLDPLGGSGNPDHPQDLGYWHWAEVTVLDANNLEGEPLEQLSVRWAVDEEWSLREFELSEASLGKEVVIRFALFVDHLGPAKGWFIDDVTVSTFGPTHATGAYSVTAATVRGNWQVEYDAQTIDVLHIEDSLDITGATVNFLGTEAVTQEALIFATYGSLTGTFVEAQNVPVGYTLEYGYLGNNIALVPDNGTPDSAYDTWALSHSLDPATNGAPDADANGDGIRNLAAFAMGLSPVDFHAAPTVTWANGDLELAYTRDLAVADEVEIVATASADLIGEWTAAGVEDQLVETVDGIEHRVARVPADGDRAFLRLEFNTP